MSKPAIPQNTDGPIVSGCVYPEAEFRRRLGWGVRAMRSARYQGLPVRYFANRAYVAGDDFLAWLQTLPTKRE